MPQKLDLPTPGEFMCIITYSITQHTIPVFMGFCCEYNMWPWNKVFAASNLKPAKVRSLNHHSNGDLGPAILRPPLVLVPQYSRATGMSNQSRLIRYQSRLMSFQSRLMSYQSRLMSYQSRLMSYQSRLMSYQSRLMSFQSRLISYQSRLMSYQSRQNELPIPQ